MNDPALSLIDEFVRSPDPAHRKNAVTALVALGNADSIERVVTLATADDDSRVSECAERELARLSKVKDKELLLSGVMATALSGDGGRSVKAYELMGRILSAGGGVSMRSPSSWTRALLAWSMMTSYASRRRMTVRWRVFRGGFFSAALLFLFLYIATIQTGMPLDIGEGWAWCLGSVLLGAVWATLATLLSAPLGNQYYWRTALGLELILTAIPGAVAALIALSVNDASPGGDRDSLVWLGLVGLGPVIRLGTIAGAPVMGRMSPHSRWGQILGGACAGAVFLTWVCLALPRPIGSYLWGLLLPAAAGIAYGHTVFDQLESPGPSRIGMGLLGKTGRVLAISCAGVCLTTVVLVAVGHHALAREEALEPLDAGDSVTREYRIGSRTKSTLELQVRQTMTCRADMQPAWTPDYGKASLSLNEAAKQVDSSPINYELQPGQSYQLVVHPNSGDVGTVLSHFRSLATRHFDGPTLRVTLAARDQPSTVR